MPGAVRAARTLAYVAAGLTVLTALVAGAAAGPRTAGAVMGSQFPALGALICAIRFGTSRSGARITAIVFASLMILFGLGALGNGIPVGIVQTGLGIAIVAALCQHQSRVWFTRTRR